MFPVGIKSRFKGAQLIYPWIISFTTISFPEALTDVLQQMRKTKPVLAAAALVIPNVLLGGGRISLRRRIKCYCATVTTFAHARPSGRVLPQPDDARGRRGGGHDPQASTSQRAAHEYWKTLVATHGQPVRLMPREEVS
jgi:hypothetical protein